MNGCLKSTSKVISNSATTSSSSPVSVCWQTTSASRKTSRGWKQRKRKRCDRPQPRVARLKTWLLLAPLLVTELSWRCRSRQATTSAGGQKAKYCDDQRTPALAAKADTPLVDCSCGA